MGDDHNTTLISFIYRVSQEEFGRLREGVPYVKVCQYNPKHLCPGTPVYEMFIDSNLGTSVKKKTNVE
jgi:hypothetical protein